MWPIMNENSAKPRPPIHPYLVMLIAIVAPGSGHWAAGNIQRGVMFAWFIFVLGWISWRLTGPEISPVGRLAGGLLIYAISVMDAYRLARFRWAQYQTTRGAGAPGA
jgi:hypothetical protein